MSKTSLTLLSGCVIVLALSVFTVRSDRKVYADDAQQERLSDDSARKNAEKMITEGRHTFRFDTFGDEAFWGDASRLQEAVEGAKLGGIGPGLSPRTALALGLKVDVEALPKHVVRQVEHGQVDLDNPATTITFLQSRAVVGLTGFFNGWGGLRSIGIQCALCHSTVNNSVAPGIGHRLDGWANRDLNVGAIVSLAPNLNPITNLLGIDVPTLQKVLGAWDPGNLMPRFCSTEKVFALMANRLQR